MNKNDLEKQYAALCTNELLEIVDRKFDYRTPDTIISDYTLK